MRKAYQEIHRRNVLHGDVWAANILVSSNQSVYIVDFESARFDAESILEDEMAQVEKLFAKIKREPEQGLVSK